MQESGVPRAGSFVGPGLLRHLFLFAAFLVAAGTPVRAQEALSAETWKPPEKVRVAPSELAFTDRRYPTTKNEGVFLLSWFNDGWLAMLNLFHFENALFRRWGLYALVAEPDGTAHWFTSELDGRMVVIDGSRLYVSDGRNVVDGTDGRYRARFEIEGFSCDLTFTNLVGPWKPGDGFYPLSADGRAFQKRLIPAPLAEVTGWMVVGTREIVVRGQGYAEKSLIVNSLRRLNPLLYTMRVYSRNDTPVEDRWHIGLLETVTHPAYGTFRMPRLYMIHGGEWIFATTDYTISFSRLVQPAGYPYKVPFRFRLSARANGYLLEGEYRARVLFQTTDVMSEIPRWLRPILLMFIKRPVYFRFLGGFSGTLTDPDGTVTPIRLQGPYEYVVVY